MLNSQDKYIAHSYISTLPLSINPHLKKSTYSQCVYLRSMSAFQKKTQETDLQFFLTFFDKIKSQKRC